MIFRELILEDEFDGVNAISLVDAPAIMKNFVHFSEEIELRTVKVDGGFLDLDEFWKYTASPDDETIPTSHKFCKLKAGNVFHISEIRGWDSKKSSYEGFIQESDYFKDFKGSNSVSFNIDNQLYNCRHHFKRVRKARDVPEWKQQQWKKKTKFSNEKVQKNIQFNIDKEKREIVGLALVPNLMIPRHNVGNTGKSGYVWLSKKTIKQIKEKYGFNRTLTIQHEADITGRAILLDSWLCPDDKDIKFNVESIEGSWALRYKIIDDKLWQLIKDQSVVGFSIESFFSLREPK